MSSSLLDIISVDSFHNGLPKYFQHIVTLFEQSRAFTHVADFARLALQPLESTKLPAQNPDYDSLRTDLLSRLFHASLKTCQFDQAYSALSRYTDFALQKSALTSLITSILSVSGTAGVQKLLRFPLSLTPNLFTHVDETLVSLAKKQALYPVAQSSSAPWSSGFNNNTVTITAPDYDRILHAYRVARHDFRGAAEIGYRIVQRLRKIRDGPPTTSSHNHTEDLQQIDEDDPESKELRQELLSLINLLACVEKSNAYILVEVEKGDTTSRNGSSMEDTNDGNVFIDSPTASTDRRKSSRGDGISSPTSPALVLGGSNKQQQQQQKRIVVTLTDLRREYQAELDRVSRIERGDYAFGDIQGGGQNDDGDGFSDDLEDMDTL